MVGYQRQIGCGYGCGFAIPLSLPFILLILTLIIMVEGTGRFIPKVVSPPMMERDEKTILRSSIGSRPPICVRRCYSCEQCEAIQVPTGIKANSYSSSSASASGLMSDINVAYARGDHVSNYKPMSWKCKCGTSIFNP